MVGSRYQVKRKSQNPTFKFLAAFLNQGPEFREQRRRIMRAGRGFGMILHAENRLGLVPHALDRLVVQIDPVHGQLRRQDFGIHGETVVLRRDFDLAGCQILHRLVGAAMAELQFEGFPAERLAENLVAQANPKNRDAAVHERFHFAHNVIERRRVTGAVGEKNARRLVLRARRAAEAVAGKTCDANPCCRNRRKMLYFIP